MMFSILFLHHTQWAGLGATLSNESSYFTVFGALRKIAHPNIFGLRKRIMLLEKYAASFPESQFLKDELHRSFSWVYLLNLLERNSDLSLYPPGPPDLESKTHGYSKPDRNRDAFRDRPGPGHIKTHVDSNPSKLNYTEFVENGKLRRIYTPLEGPRPQDFRKPWYLPEFTEEQVHTLWTRTVKVIASNILEAELFDRSLLAFLRSALGLFPQKETLLEDIPHHCPALGDPLHKLSGLEKNDYSRPKAFPLNPFFPLFSRLTSTCART